MLYYRIHNDALSFDGHDPAIESEDEDNTEPDSSDSVDGNFEDSESEDDEDEPIIKPASTNHKFEDQAEKLLLYQGARITIAMSMVLIMTFVMRRHLSGAALVDLLSLIEIHCLIPNSCATSMSQIRKFFKNLKQPLEFHYFCSNKACKNYLGVLQPESCPLCKKKTKSKSDYFIIIPLLVQLRALLASKLLVNIYFSLSS